MHQQILLQYFAMLNTRYKTQSILFHEKIRGSKIKQGGQRREGIVESPHLFNSTQLKFIETRYPDG